MMNREQRRAARRIKRPAPVRFKPWERLSDQQVQDLALCHLINLDALVSEATTEEEKRRLEATLYQWIGGVLTWHYASRLVHQHEADMDDQLALARTMIRRHHVDGRIGFTGPEYQLAKRGVEVMDALADVTPKVKAIEAANRSEKELARLALTVQGVAA